MSEQDRARLYDWLCEQAGEQRAEYLMSCLAPAPLSDLVTKEHLDTVLAAEFSAFALSMAAQREADRDQAAAQREADRDQAAAQREADRDTASKRHRLLVAAAIVLALEIVAAEAGWLRRLTDMVASVI